MQHTDITSPCFQKQLMAKDIRTLQKKSYGWCWQAVELHYDRTECRAKIKATNKMEDSVCGGIMEFKIKGKTGDSVVSTHAYSGYIIIMGCIM